MNLDYSSVVQSDSKAVGESLAPLTVLGENLLMGLHPVCHPSMLTNSITVQPGEKGRVWSYGAQGLLIFLHSVKIKSTCFQPSRLKKNAK